MMAMTSHTWTDARCYYVILQSLINVANLTHTSFGMLYNYQKAKINQDYTFSLAVDPSEGLRNLYILQPLASGCKSISPQTMWITSHCTTTQKSWGSWKLSSIIFQWIWKVITCGVEGVFELVSVYYLVAWITLPCTYLHTPPLWGNDVSEPQKNITI